MSTAEPDTAVGVANIDVGTLAVGVADDCAMGLLLGKAELDMVCAAVVSACDLCFNLA